MEIEYFLHQGKEKWFVVILSYIRWWVTDFFFFPKHSFLMLPRIILHHWSRKHVCSYRLVGLPCSTPFCTLLPPQSLCKAVWKWQADLALSIVSQHSGNGATSFREFERLQYINYKMKKWCSQDKTHSLTARKLGIKRQAANIFGVKFCTLYLLCRCSSD